MKEYKLKRSNFSYVVLFCFLSLTEARSEGPPFVVSLEALTTPPVPGANYGISVHQEQFGAGLLLSLDNTGILRPVAGTAGIKHVWYSTNQGDVFDFTYVSSRSDYFWLSFPPQKQIDTNLNVPFYLSFWVGGNLDNSLPSGFYGWAKLERNNVGMALLDSAIAPDGLGIVVGTSTAVPEPSTYALMGLGLLVILIYGTKTRGLLAR